MSQESMVQERRAQSLDRLRSLVRTRTETLSLFSELASKRPFKPEPVVQELLQTFCEALVDYTASAHFQLYRFIQDGSERRRDVLQAAQDVYDQIAETTGQILDFNDKYDCEDHCDNLSALAEDLSRLGEVLADRINLEDRIIGALQNTARRR